MNLSISRYWNAFKEKHSLQISSPKNILYANNVDWENFLNSHNTALLIPLSQLQIIYNPIPTINDYIMLVDESLDPKCILKITQVEVLPYLSIDIDMKKKLGNHYADILWRNYFARNLSIQQNSNELNNQFVVYLEFNLISK